MESLWQQVGERVRSARLARGVEPDVAARALEVDRTAVTKEERLVSRRLPQSTTGSSTWCQLDPCVMRC